MREDLLTFHAVEGELESDHCTTVCKELNSRGVDQYIACNYGNALQVCVRLDSLLHCDMLKLGAVAVRRSPVCATARCDPRDGAVCG